MRTICRALPALAVVSLSIPAPAAVAAPPGHGATVCTGVAPTTEWTGAQERRCGGPPAAHGNPVSALLEHGWTGSDGAVCPMLAEAHEESDPEHDGPEPSQVLYVDHEGDVFVDDGDGDGQIREAQTEEEMYFDCPPFGWSQEGADQEDGHVLDHPERDG